MRILRVPDAGTSGPPKEPSASPYGEVSESEIVLGGCYRELGFRIQDADAPDGLKLDKVRTLIRKVGFSEMDILAKSWNRPNLEAMLYLKVDAARVEQLIEPSFETAVQEGRRLNFTLLQKWLRWQMEAMTANGESDRIDQILEKVMREKLQEPALDKS